ncbi:MAG: immunoglobulin domain-containing protein [Opitutaceae bacterium]|nr:immunoglobulin domain-containing protein [Opitutaceae bacterium]
MKTHTYLGLTLAGAFAALTSAAAFAQAPAITAQPAAMSVAAGGTANLSVTATGAAPLTYAWFKEARLVSFGANAALTITSANPGDAGAYRVVVSNAAGSAVSDSVVLTVTGAGNSGGTVTPPPFGTSPAITTQPAPLQLAAGANATFAVVATGTAPLRYQWLKNGRAINNATGAALTLTSVKIDDAAVYSVAISNSAGTLKSAPASLTVGAITTAPASQTVNAGTEARLTVTAPGAALTYQWKFNGRTLKGATAATLTLPNVGVTAGGDYTVTVSNASGPLGASAAALAIRTDARLVNIATRGHVGDDDEVLISGFVIRGTGTKKILARAVGPTLGTQFGVAGALAAPKLTLHRGPTVVDTNSGWGGSAALAGAFTQVGAFPLPAASADAAILANLGPANYGAIVTAPRGQEGVALIEIYDADTGTPAGEIINISTRALVGSEVANTLIAGFAISGTTSDTVLVRGVGPSLGTLFGMRRALGASHIRVYDSKGVEVAANTEWGKGPRGNDRDEDHEDDIDDACDRVGAWRLPRGSTDSALLLTLAPGVYSVHVTGVRNATGIAMVEVFEVR